MRDLKDLKSKKDYEDFLEEAISFFEKKQDSFYSGSALSLLNLFKDSVVIERQFKDKNLLRIEIEEALEPYPNSIHNFIVKEMDGLITEQKYLSTAFYGATIYESLVD